MNYLDRRDSAVHPSFIHGDGCFMGSGVVIDENVRFWEGVRVFNNTVIRNNVELGCHSTLGHLVLIEAHTSIGANTTIQSQCHVTAHAIIEDRVFFGPGVIMTNESNIAGQGRDIEPRIQTTHIKRGARIGAGTLILPGITIGKNAFVGAGSLVNKDIPDAELWVGRPARRVRAISEEEWV